LFIDDQLSVTAPIKGTKETIKK